VALPSPCRLASMPADLVAGYVRALAGNVGHVAACRRIPPA
jgi:hypothetical protein